MKAEVWRGWFAGVQRLKHFEQQNTELERPYTEVALENTVIEDVLYRKLQRSLPSGPSQPS